MSDPNTSIRAAIPCPKGGRVVTMGFPGLTIAISGSAVIDPALRAETLDHPSLADCPILIALIEEQELPEGELDALRAALRARGADLAHLPIPDAAAPTPAFEAQWRLEEARFHACLDQGRPVGITCHYGAGRSGTIAARFLIDRGMRPVDAIAAVRAGFAESIETDAQHAWLMGLR